jgi:arylsulfatase A-like enzyme
MTRRDWLTGAGLGALGIALLHLFSLAMFLSGAAHSGPAQMREAASTIAPHLIWFLLETLLAAAILGALFGIAAAILLAPFSRVSATRVSLISLALTLLFGLRTVAARPALFEDALWRRGGILAQAQVFLVEIVCVPTIDRLLALALVVWFVLALRRHRTSLAINVRRAIPVLVAAAALGLAFLLAKALHKPHAHREGPPDLIVLAADSLRPDRFASEGNPRSLTPTLDELRRGGLWADDFIVPIASTTASWTSLLTGVFPHQHGIRDLFPRDEETHPHLPTLARLLEAHGYQTAVVSDYAGESFSRVDLGFQTVDAPPATTIEVVAEREAFQRLPLMLAFFSGGFGQHIFPVAQYLPVNANPGDLTSRVLAQLHRLEERDQPFLLVAFYSVTHAPFAAPMPDAAAFTDPHYQGQSRYSYEIQQLDDIGRASVRPSETEVAQIRALYDGALLSFDREVATVLRALDHDGIDDRVIVINGDHGENLFEPGTTTEHGKWFVGGEAANRTALILNGTGVAPGHIAGLSSGVDYLPTLLELAHVPAPPNLDGVSLLHPQPGDQIIFAESTIWLGGDADRPEQALSLPGVLELLEVSPESHAPVLKRTWADRTVTARLRIARQGSLELVYTPRKGALPRYQLFDLKADPFAEHDLAPAHPEQAEPLRRALLGFLRADPLRWFDGQERLRERVEQ